MKQITIGARGSNISLAYAAKVKRLILMSETSLSSDDIEIQSIKTSGDIFHDKKLSEIGGKNLFCKEIEESLITKKIDIAVHSLKDMAAVEIASLNIAAYIARNDFRDAFISFKHSNVKKLKDGLYDGIVLALAGIKTLKLEENVKHIFTTEEMLPAVGQGIIAAQCRKDDTNIIKILKKINNEETKQCAIAERSLLKTLGGDCDTAVGGLAVIENNELILSAQLFSDNGDQDFVYKAKGKRENGASIGMLAGTELLKKAGNTFKKK